MFCHEVPIRDFFLSNVLEGVAGRSLYCNVCLPLFSFSLCLHQLKNIPDTVGTGTGNLQFET